MRPFIGRSNELKKLKNLLNQKVASLILLKGRRRIGKSRLLKEFGTIVGKATIFSGLPPEQGITAQDQRDEFARQLHVELGLSGIEKNDWSHLFWHLAEKTKKEKRLIVFDEIAWMAEGDHTFLPKLKVAWDLYFTKNPNLILALCSSISIWIDENILSSTGFLGRESLTMTLAELPLQDCKQFWPAKNQTSPQEKLLTLSITGGIPRYLEAINPNHSVEQNIQSLCFSQEGILYNEFEKIFSDLFNPQKNIYRNIVETLVHGPAEAQAILSQLSLKNNGDNYKIIENLEKSGFVTHDVSWHLKSGKLSKLKKYRLADNYCRFYLKYIQPNQEKIKHNHYESLNLFSLPNWTSIIGLQIENLVLNNRQLIKQALNISPQEIVFDNPYYQRKTQRKKGCQIDYLIQTQFNTIYVCEIKYSKKPIGSKVIEEVQEKINAIAVPKNFSIRPVLIHCHDVSETVEESGFFTKIINFTEFLR